MELLLLVCFCLLSGSGVTFGAENRPTIIRVKEGHDVILPCSLSTKQSIDFEVFDWIKDRETDGRKEVLFYDRGDHYNNGRDGQDLQFRGRVSHFPDKLKSGDASITIRNTMLADSGVYTCIFPNLQPEQRFHIKLLVGVRASQPSIKFPRTTANGRVVYLKCEVGGAFPKPKLYWQDGAGNVLPAEEQQETEREGLYDITLQLTVTKSDHYRCVAIQEEINHQAYDQLYMSIHGDNR